MKPLPMLSHMPWNVLEKIVGSTDMFSRFSLRKCSRDLRSLADNVEFEMKGVAVLIFKNKIIIHLFNRELDGTITDMILAEYLMHPQGCLIRNGRIRKLYKNEDHMSMALADYFSIISNPKMSMEQLNFYPGFGEPVTVELQQQVVKFFDSLAPTLRKLPHQLSVKNLHLGCFELSMDMTMTILDYIKPQNLIGCALNLIKGHADISKLTNSAHWKTAKHLELRADTYLYLNMAHFLTVHLREVKLSVEDVRWILGIALLQKAKVNYLFYYAENGKTESDSAIHSYLEPFLESENNGEKQYSFEVPQLPHCLKVKTTERTIELRSVEKTPKEDNEEVAAEAEA